MKTFKLIFLFIFLLSLNGYAQEKKSDHDASKKNNPEQAKDWSNTFKYDSLKYTKDNISTADFRQTTSNPIRGASSDIVIYFKDGTTVKGSIFKFKKSGYVYFKDNKRVQKKKYPIHLVKYVSITPDYLDNQGVIHLGKKNVYRKISGVYKELQVVEEGSVDLYMIEGYTNHMNYIYRNFYVQRKSENQMTLIAKKKMSNIKFIKKATIYFKDCPKLISKISNNRYSYKEIEDIVRYYNLSCNSTKF